jgi:hypothetical protein
MLNVGLVWEHHGESAVLQISSGCLHTNKEHNLWCLF